MLSPCALYITSSAITIPTAYVLAEDEDRVRAEVAANPFTPVELVQPLALRANAGDDIRIVFTNRLPFATGIHVQGVEYNVQTSDGSWVGCNENSLAPPCPPGGTHIYEWKVVREGIHHFSDLANPLSSARGSNVHGLFGALIVEPRGSWWTDPVTGEPSKSGVFADVHNPLLPSFREFVFFFHDEPEVKDLTGSVPIDPMTLQASPTPAINYRSEPHRNRARLIMTGVVCPDCDGEEVHHDSWVFGDPDTPVFRTYVGDPIKLRLIHGGVQETHEFHWHVHQWRFEANDPDSDIVDVQAVGPQSAFSISPLYGAGSLQGAFGDIVMHCHLYPHFTDGMWCINRAFNTLQDGSQCYPNGLPIAPLKPLPDREPPPLPTPEKPGFPNFIPGIFGCKAPRPPLGIEGGREPTAIERNQFAPNARPGAVFVNPCRPGINPEREFDVVAIQMPVVYNRQGWHDPEGRLFVLAEDEAEVRAGAKPPEPLVLRANAGDCVRVRFTNKFREVIGGNAFQLATRTYESSMHIHFVKFDPLVSDGANVGWNYDFSVLPGETIWYQWFADVELRNAFFHDHLFANTHQQHGVFGSIVVEPRGSQYLDSCTGKEIRAGTQATIVNPLIPDFRELALFVHDFALLFDADGCPLNKPPFPGSHDDPGVMGVNYRNEPLQFRIARDCRPHALPGASVSGAAATGSERPAASDPAYVFSSFVHGDPVTPMLLTYNGDPVRIRLMDGAHEESHSFNLHRQRWNRMRNNLNSELIQQQHINIAEHFTLEFAMEGEGDFDCLYHFGSIDDIWLGNWGIFRSFGQRVPHLIPLPDRPAPPPRTKPLPERTGKRPPRARGGVRPRAKRQPGRPGPESVPVRHFDVFALPARIVYNEAGDHDPYGLVFALAKDVPAILNGEKNPEPLILRANVGDIVDVTLYNGLLAAGDDSIFHGARGPHRPDGTEAHGYPGVPVDAPFPPSLRISLHPQLLVYDVRSSDGATVGFNPDQTVAPGKSITYRWYVDREVGAVNLWDMADLRNHRHHGAFGAFIAEPRGSIYLDPFTGEEVDVGGNQVVILNPFLPAFREFVLVMHDGVRLVDAAGNLIIDPEPVVLPGGDGAEQEELADFEDQGSRGFNYRSERLHHRLAELPDLAAVFTSRPPHRDPATPFFLAHVGDPVVVRMVVAADKPRAHTFTIHGHTWRRDANDGNSAYVSLAGEMSVGYHKSLFLAHGAGGLLGVPGDYMYRSGNLRWDVKLGMWGIIRVLEKGAQSGMHGDKCGNGRKLLALSALADPLRPMVRKKGVRQDD